MYNNVGKRSFYLWWMLGASLCGAALANAELRCAAKFIQSAAQTTPIGSRGAVVIFARFGDENPRQNNAPSWAEGLLDPQRQGSISHFYDEMSFARLRISGEVAPRRYASLGATRDYLAAGSDEPGDFARFSREILNQADRDINFARFDNDGPDGVPNSGDDDGLVDGVFIVVSSTPQNFLLGRATGIASLGEEPYRTDDRGADGRPIEIRAGTIQQGRTFAETSGTICHEYGHLLGLPDLFDVGFIRSGSEDPMDDSAGIGNWGLMGWGALGWQGDDGPTSLSAWSRMRLGWVTLQTPVQLEQELRIDPVGESGKAYQVPMPNGEFFLLEYRTRSSNFYDRNIPAEGLLVWHVGGVNAPREIDLECADGRFLDAGFSLGGQRDPVAGGDNLDFWSRDAVYNRIFAGNLGDKTDPFDGIVFRDFTPESNPAALSEDLEWSARIENIRLDGGQMVADIAISPVVRVSQVQVLDENRDGILVVGETAELIFDLVTPGNSGTLRTVISGPDSLVELVRAEAIYTIDPISQLDSDGPVRYRLTDTANQLRLREKFAGSNRTSVRVEVQEQFGEGWVLLWGEEVELEAVAARQQVAAVTVIDSMGNGDGQVQAGEIFHLQLLLDLVAPALLQGLSFRLRPLDADVERLGGGQLSFRRPNRYDQRSVAGPEFLAGGELVAGAVLNFELEVSSDFTLWRDTLQVEVASGIDRTPPRVLGVKARSREDGLWFWLPGELVLEGGGVGSAHVRVFAADGGAEAIVEIPLVDIEGEFVGIWPDAWPGTDYLLQTVVADREGNEGRSPLQRVALPVPGEHPAEQIPVGRIEQRLGAVAMSSDSRWLAVADGAEVRIYDGRDLVLLHTFAADYAEALAFDADGDLLAVGGRDGSVQVWAVSDGGERAFFAGHQGRVAGLAFSQVGELASVGADGRLVIWDLATGGRAEELTAQSGAGLQSVAFSNNGRHLAAATANAEVVLWTGRQRVESVLLGHAGQVESVSFSADGDWLASGGRDGQVWVWNLGRGGQGRTLGEGGGWVQSVSFSADGKWLAAGGVDGNIRVWDRVGFQLERELDAGSGIEDLVFGEGGVGARLLVGTWQGALLLTLAAGTGVTDETVAPILFPAYPNPFNNAVQIPYRLVKDGRVVLRVYDVLGQEVRRVDLGLQAAGYYYGPGRAVVWDGRDERGRRVGSGLYLYEVQANGLKARRKIVLVQ